jgi:hypothetical protein
MRSTHKKLWTCWIDEEQHRRTCGYWFLVYADGMAHTAFETRAGLDRWLRERGLSLGNELDSQPSSSPIVGEYRTESHMEAQALAGLTGELTRSLSNGDYVDAVITTDADGLRTVHTLNPNVRERRVYDYAESRRMMR